VVDVQIVRDRRVMPGGEGIVEMPGELLFVVSAQGVTQEGADGLLSCWRWFIDRGLWRYQDGGGDMLTTTYHLVALEGASAEVETSAGLVRCWLSRDHFARGSANGLQTAARASVRRGWRYYAPAVLPMAEAG
jgi:hypothetical protein